MRAGNGVRLIAVLVGVAATNLIVAWGIEQQAEAPAAPPAALVLFTQHATAGEHAGDTDVGAQLLSFTGELLWEEGERSVSVSAATSLERNAVAVPDGTGGCIVAFEMAFVTGEAAGDVDIYAQRISAAGELLWNEGERSVAVASSAWRERNPVILPDGAGGAIVIFEQHAPPEGERAGDVDIYAQRISPEGVLLWHQGESSTPVADSTMPERAPAAVPDGQGGAIVVFEVELTYDQHKGDVDLGAQRIDASGRMLWNEGQASSELATSKWHERRPVAVADGSGGAIVAFEQHGRPGSEYQGDIDVAAQRISAEGELLWGEEGSLALAEAEQFLERAPAVLGDGDGGAWVVFEGEARSGENVGDVELLAQRVTPSGQLVWPERPIMVAASDWSERAPVVLSDGAAGVIVVFEEHARAGSEHAGDVDIGGQRLSPAGKKLWNDGGNSAMVASGEWLERRPCALPDGAGGVVVAFEAEVREGEHAGDVEIYAQRIDASGAMVWNEGERSTMVAASKWRETDPRAVAAR